MSQYGNIFLNTDCTRDVFSICDIYSCFSPPYREAAELKYWLEVSMLS